MKTPNWFAFGLSKPTVMQQAMVDKYITERLREMKPKSSNVYFILALCCAAIGFGNLFGGGSLFGCLALLCVSTLFMFMGMSLNKSIDKSVRRIQRLEHGEYLVAEVMATDFVPYTTDSYMEQHGKCHVIMEDGKPGDGIFYTDYDFTKAVCERRMSKNHWPMLLVVMDDWARLVPLKNPE